MHHMTLAEIARGLADKSFSSEELTQTLLARIAALEAAGIARDRLILDPGMGFFLGPKPETSFEVLSRLGELAARFGLPVFISVSRKSFLRSVTGRAPGEAAAATLAAELLAVLGGAAFIRTHEPGPLKDALAVAARFGTPAPGN